MAVGFDRAGWLVNDCTGEPVHRVWWRTANERCSTTRDLTRGRFPFRVTADGATLNGRRVLVIAFIDDEGEKLTVRYRTPRGRGRLCAELRPKPPGPPAEKLTAGQALILFPSMIGIALIGGWAIRRWS